MARTEAALSIAPGDESLHAPGTDPLWSESLYLNFSDASGGPGGFARLSRHPNRREADALVGLYLPDGGVGLALYTGPLPEPDGARIAVGPLAFTCCEPLREWRVAFDGDVHVFADAGRVAEALASPSSSAASVRVALDLQIRGLHAPFHYPQYRRVAQPPPHVPRPRGWAQKVTRALRRPAEIRSALNMRKGRHYEQSVNVVGTVHMAGEPFVIEGSGHRDHSWGPRDWAPAERWRWLTGQFDGMAFNAMYMTIAGTHVTNGYVWTGGACVPIDDLHLDATFDEEGLAGRTISLELSAGGVRHTVTGDVLVNVPLPITGPRFSTRYTIGRTRYRCGDRVGCGVAEFLERLTP